MKPLLKELYKNQNYHQRNNRYNPTVINSETHIELNYAKWNDEIVNGRKFFTCDEVKKRTFLLENTQKFNFKAVELIQI